MIRISIRTKEQAHAAVTRFGELWVKHRDKGLLMTLEPYRPPASNRQTTKLVLMLNELAETSGNEPEAMRLWFRREHFPTKTLRLKKTELVEPKEFKELYVAEASALIEKVRVIAHEAGYVLQEGAE